MNHSPIQRALRWLDWAEGADSQVPGPTFLFFNTGYALVAVKCEFFAGNDRFTLYVNPPRGQPEPASGTVKFNSDLGTVANVSLVMTGADFCTIMNLDELRFSP